MQERYDEAEEALRKALEIEPDYDAARENLAMLPIIRKTGPTGMSIRDPGGGRRTRQSIQFIEQAD
jgi:hypothetical protein